MWHAFNEITRRPVMTDEAYAAQQQAFDALTMLDAWQ
jgi:hypothetical protein